MQHLEVSCAVRRLWETKRLTYHSV